MSLEPFLALVIRLFNEVPLGLNTGTKILYFFRITCFLRFLYLCLHFFLFLLHFFFDLLLLFLHLFFLFFCLFLGVLQLVTPVFLLLFPFLALDFVHLKEATEALSTAKVRAIPCRKRCDRKCCGQKAGCDGE